MTFFIICIKIEYESHVLDYVQDYIQKRMQGAGQLWYYSYGLFGVLRFNISNAKASIADIRAPNKLSHCKKISEK